MDVLRPSSSATSHPPHPHHRMIADDRILEASESSMNGWQNLQSPKPRRSQRASPITSPYDKGKARESDDERTPRRLAASKTLRQVMRNSAPPTPAGALNEELAQASTSNVADTGAVASASSPLLRPALSNSGTAANQRKQVSLSPLPTMRRTALASPLVSSAASLPQDDARDDLDIAEIEQFKFHAAPSSQTAILARQPPNLPYDPTYLPLSPNGIDQVGHNILLPLQNQSSASGKAAEAAKVGKGTSTQSRKVLPGQEMENHVISEIPGQKPMPWGLKATLLERQQGGPRAKTKTGVVKRTA